MQSSILSETSYQKHMPLNNLFDDPGLSPLLVVFMTTQAAPTTNHRAGSFSLAWP